MDRARTVVPVQKATRGSVRATQIQLAYMSGGTNAVRSAGCADERSIHAWQHHERGIILAVRSDHALWRNWDMALLVTDISSRRRW